MFLASVTTAGEAGPGWPEALPLLPHPAEIIVGLVAFGILYWIYKTKVVPKMEELYEQRAAAIEKAHGITVQVVRRPGNRCDWAPVAWGWLTQSRLLATRLAN